MYEIIHEIWIYIGQIDEYILFTKGNGIHIDVVESVNKAY
jgi:hypothetical protein